jgi:hypothetical protein
MRAIGRALWAVALVLSVATWGVAIFGLGYLAALSIGAKP